MEAQPMGSHVNELNTSSMGRPSSPSMTARTAAGSRGGMSLRNGWNVSTYSLGTTPPWLEAIFCPLL